MEEGTLDLGCPAGLSKYGVLCYLCGRKDIHRSVIQTVPQLGIMVFLRHCDDSEGSEEDEALST